MAIKSDDDKVALETLLDIIKTKDKLFTENIQFSYVYKDVQVDLISFLAKGRSNAQEKSEQDVILFQVKNKTEFKINVLKIRRFLY